MTSSRIQVAGNNRFTVTGVEVVFVVIMTTSTLGNDLGLVILPVRMGMNIVVTGRAGHVVQLVYAGEMLTAFFFVTADAFRFLRHDITGDVRVE